jgi:hypothetical protein
LNADSNGTWAANDTLWPELFLSHDLPECQIWLYDYDSAVFSSSQATTLDSVAQELLRAVVERRAKDDLDLPILWVAHSIGGLLVKTVRSIPLSPSQTKVHLFLGTRAV